MDRVTEEERARFHKIVDDSIDKMNSPKNSVKIHWSKHNIKHLQKMQMVESHELDLSVYESFNEEYTISPIESECYDCINIPLMIIDNLRGNK